MARSCLDGDGKPKFYDLLYRRGAPVFIAFDILARGDEVLRHLPLVNASRSCGACCATVQLTSRAVRNGIALFERAFELDLEGFVEKHRGGNYTSDAEASTWFKIRNRNYSQWAGRSEAFERDRHREPGCWMACVRAGVCSRSVISRPALARVVNTATITAVLDMNPLAKMKVRIAARAAEQYGR
jgi:hypothetical protein